MTAAEERTIVQLRRRFRASPRMVFDAWTDPAKVRTWVTTQGCADEVVRVDLKPRIGQPFALVVRRGGDEVTHSGEYLEIVRFQRLVFTWMVPTISKETTLVSVHFERAPGPWGGTDLVLKHERVLPSDATRTEARWGAALDAIAGLLDP